MIRFQLVDPECWERSLDGNHIYVSAEFDAQTNQVITDQMCHGKAPEDWRACWIELVYDVQADALAFWDAAIEEFCLEDGVSYAKPFGNPTWVEAITLAFHDDEVRYVRERLDEILAQIDKNEELAKNTPPEPESEWDDDYLR